MLSIKKKTISKKSILLFILLLLSFFNFIPVKANTGQKSALIETSKKTETAKPAAKKTIDVKPVIKEENKIIQESKASTHSAQTTGSIVELSTDKGPIKIELYTKESPITTSNFIDLVKKGFYDGVIFHRVVKGFVIQGGDPLGNGTGNYIDPETNKPRYIKHESSENLKWDKMGKVGMARTADPDSASCQFFISLAALPSLDPGGVDPYGYAIFGQVTDDTIQTIKKIMEDNKPEFPGSERPSNPVKILSAKVISK